MVKPEQFRRIINEMRGAITVNERGMGHDFAEERDIGLYAAIREFAQCPLHPIDRVNKSPAACCHFRQQ